jgi:hypothetical protein
VTAQATLFDAPSTHVRAAVVRSRTGPSHIIADPMADRALCGEKHPCPVTLDRHVQAHTIGSGAEWCPACHQVWTAA